MVEPHHDLVHPKFPEQHLLDENLGLHAGQSRREGQHDGHLHTGLGNEFQPLLERGDGHRCPVRLEYLGRARIERTG
jgi:hypothetical protein